MGHTPRHLVLGSLVLVVVLWSSRTASSQPADTDVLRGSVIGGVAVAGTGWQVTHPSPGLYRIVITGRHVSLDVPSWDTAADLTIIPGGTGSSELRFSAGGQPVDTDFDFVALLD